MSKKPTTPSKPVALYLVTASATEAAEEPVSNVVRLPVRAARAELEERARDSVVQLQNWRWRRVIAGLRRDFNATVPISPLALAWSMGLEPSPSRRALGAYVEAGVLYFDTTAPRAEMRKDIMLAILPTLMYRYGEPTDAASIASLAFVLMGGVSGSAQITESNHG